MERGLGQPEFEVPIVPKYTIFSDQRLDGRQLFLSRSTEDLRGRDDIIEAHVRPFDRDLKVGELKIPFIELYERTDEGFAFTQLLEDPFLLTKLIRRPHRPKTARIAFRPLIFLSFLRAYCTAS